MLTGLVCPAARPLGVRQYPGALKGCGVKMVQSCLVYPISYYKEMSSSNGTSREIMSSVFLVCTISQMMFGGVDDRYYPEGCASVWRHS